MKSGESNSSENIEIETGEGEALEMAGERASESEPRSGAAGVPAEPAESAVERLEAQLSESQDRYLRVAAEYDNYRKRVARERVELADRAQSAVIAKLLDVVDDLNRLVGLEQSAEGALREAVVMVDRKLWKELEAAGLERIDPVGTLFDPQLHEAVAITSPDPDDPAAQPDIVRATFQIGYRFKGVLLRPARVQVYSAIAES